MAAVIVRLCTAMGIKKIYSTPYRPQGNSIVESFMRTLKSGLRALVDEDGRDWDTHLQAVALAHNSTPSTATGHSPFFLEHGREAVLPVQRHLDEPRLEPVARQWLSRLWRARVACYRANMREHEERKKLLSQVKVVYPPGSVVAVKLTPHEIRQLPTKFAPEYTGPYVVKEARDEGLNYVLEHPIDNSLRRVHLRQLKLLSLPPGPEEASLPRAAPELTHMDEELARSAEGLLTWRPPTYVIDQCPAKRRAQEIVNAQAANPPSMTVGEARKRPETGRV